ncbi:hypothetical protein [Microbacterium sp.]|uniref:hypothetical protein n=1 Tax=Microbacterium sp. TaxID=51671 RepID=UPI003A944F5A
MEQGRSDDTDEAIAHRLDIYEHETARSSRCTSRGIVDRIDGVGSLDEITARISAASAHAASARWSDPDVPQVDLQDPASCARWSSRAHHAAALDACARWCGRA